MNSLLNNLLISHQMEYLILDPFFYIIDMSWGVKRFAEDQDFLKKGKDVRLAFPELIGFEEQLIAILEGQQISFELKTIARYSHLKSVFYIDIHILADVDEVNFENRLIVAFEDVTEKTIIEQTLVQRTNEATLLLNNLTAAKLYIDRIITSMADALIVTNLLGEIKTINRAAQSLLGYSEEELINQPISMIMGDEKFLLPICPLPLLPKIKNEPVQEVDVVCKTKTGAEILIAFSCSTILTDTEGVHDFVYIGRDVTERHQAEKERAQLLSCERKARAAAEASERRFRFLAESIPQLVWTALPEGKINYVNKRTFDYCGAKSEQIREWKWEKFLHPDELKLFLYRWNNCLKTGEPFEIEFRLLRAVDSNYRWHIARALPLRDSNGEIVSWFGTNTDIHDQKLAEEELRESEIAIRGLYKVASSRKLNLEQRLQGLLALGRRHFDLDGAVLAQIEGNIFKVLTAQFIRNSEFKLSKGDILNLEETYCHETFTEKDPICFESASKSQWCHHPAYKAHKIETYIGMSVIVAGKVYGVLSFFNIQERQKLFTDGDKAFLKLMAQWIGGEIERLQTLKALRQSEENFRLLVDGVTDYAIIMLDAQGRVVSWNKGAERISQYRTEDIINNNFSCFYTEDDISIGKPETNLQLAVNEGHIEDEGWRVRKDGSRFWANVVMTTLHDENGKIRGFSKVMCDITERKQAEEEIQNALQKEKELNELKSRFISMASHEFRTPLSTILASSDLLKQFGDKLSPEKKKERLNKIQTEVRNMTYLLDEVLVIGKAEAGKLEFNPVLVNLKNFSREILEEIQISSTNIHKFHFNWQNCTETAYIDEKLLRHIFNNLLSNAVKYSPQGGNIYFDIFCEDEQIVFRIRDEGIGIPEEDQKRLFETFHRGTNVGNISGTGLGLAIIKNSVELHKGKITFESNIGIGTTFTVCIPINDIQGVN